MLRVTMVALVGALIVAGCKLPDGPGGTEWDSATGRWVATQPADSSAKNATPLPLPPADPFDDDN